jgi:hypothetical protein
LSSNEIVAIFQAGSAGKCKAPTIVTQPQSQACIWGGSVTFTAVATGASPLGYQWQKNGVALNDGGNVSGSATASLTISNVTGSDAAGYSVVVSSSFGNVTSAAAGLTVLDPAITSQPANQVTVVGQTATFNVTAVGTGPLVYQWMFNGTNLPSATNSVLTLNNVSTNQAGSYSVTVTDPAGSTNSGMAMLSVVTAFLQIEGYANSQFSLNLMGVPGSSYVILASTNLVDWVPLQTNTAPFTFVDTNAASFNQRFYRAVYLDTLQGGATKDPLFITSQPTNKQVLVGQDTFLSVTAAGSGPVSYQWLFNGMSLPSATNAVLTLRDVGTNQAGTYLVMLTNGKASTNSAAVMLSVYPTASASLLLTGSTGGQFSFNLIGVPGFEYVILASTDLISWVPLQTNMSPLTFVDTNAGNFNCRFYRAVYIP